MPKPHKSCREVQNMQKFGTMVQIADHHLKKYIAINSFTTPLQMLIPITEIQLTYLTE